MNDHVTVRTILQKKQRGDKIVMVTCYDYPSALLMDDVGVDMLLVGDSLGQTVLGYGTTLPVTLDEMIHHAKAVRRGANRTLTVVDLPFLSYQVSPEDAVRSAGRVMKEAQVEAIKVEGGAWMAPTVARMVQSGIPVMGHIGVTPQSVHVMGGYRRQGRGDESARQLQEDAEALAEAGAFAIVLELVESGAATCITTSLGVPTIGIGSGPGCDGQVQVFHDLLGLYPDRHFQHAARYAEVGEAIRSAVRQYADDVHSGRFAPQAGRSE